MWDARQAAGSLPHLVYARLDAARFASVYSAKGHWALIDELSHVPASVQAMSTHVEVAPSNQIQHAESTRIAVSLQQVEQLVRDTAVTVLGMPPEGEHGLRNPQTQRRVASVHE